MNTNTPKVDINSIQLTLDSIAKSTSEQQKSFLTSLGQFIVQWDQPSVEARLPQQISDDLRSPSLAPSQLTEMTQALHAIAKNAAINPNVKTQMVELFEAAKSVKSQVANLTAEQKYAGLTSMASHLRHHTAEVLQANLIDVNKAKAAGISDAKLDRLALNEAKVFAMADALDAIAQQEDPINKVLETFYPPNNGLQIDKISKPLGIIGMIYEARPNVTSDAVGIGLKSGNVVILRPGSDCYQTSKAIVDALQQGLKASGLPTHAVQLVPTTNRDAVGLMLEARGAIDLIIPRGGLSLTQRVYDQALVPTLLHLDGNCHTYVDESADAEKALKVVINAKMRRTGICGATESLLVHKDRVADVLPKLAQALKANHCELVGDERAQAALPDLISPADAADFKTEFLGPKLSVQIVDSLAEAIEVINRNSSKHTEAIISENESNQAAFLKGIESAIVMVNTSTQFADGGEFGFGAEIGISTGSQPPRGPVGAQHLTSFAYNVRSEGSTRAGGNEVYS